MTNNKVNFTEQHDANGWAKYLPAISGFYTTHLGKDLADPNFVPQERLPKNFEYGLQGLNFLDPEYSYFNYKYGLFSAGHAERNLAKCDDREPMIHKRDRKNTVIVGDSGGFQIATGVIKLDWATVKTPAGDKLREEILRYLEHTADWSMTLDVPAFAAEGALSAKTGLTKFEDTLDVSLYNLEYFMKNRVPGATKFLSVLSGSSPENSKQWYDAVKKYSIPSEVVGMGYTEDRTLEGWAFAGINMRHMKTVLSRILDLREDNLLASKDWIHFLGVGRLDWACHLTAIERMLRKYDNPNINISFDAASPFVAAGGYALSYNYNYFKSEQFTYSMGKGIDDKRFKGSTHPMPFGGPINGRLTTGDVCYMGPGDLNKHGKVGNTSWDTTSYALVMAHNVYNHIAAVQEANRWSDIESVRKVTDYTEWKKFRVKTKSSVSDFIPNNILFFRNFVEVLLDPATTTAKAREMLIEYEDCLEGISFGKKKNDQYNNLWDHSFGTDKKIPTVEDMADMYDDAEPPVDEL